jgi:hypothetical protein
MTRTGRQRFHAHAAIRALAPTSGRSERAGVCGPACRVTGTQIIFGGSAVTAPVNLSTIVFASVNLEQLGMPESAVDVALAVLPDEPLGLLQVADPTVERLLAWELRRLWPPLRPTRGARPAAVRLHGAQSGTAHDPRSPRGLPVPGRGTHGTEI